MCCRLNSYSFFFLLANLVAASSDKESPRLGLSLGGATTTSSFFFGDHNNGIVVDDKESFALHGDAEFIKNGGGGAAAALSLTHPTGCILYNKPIIISSLPNPPKLLLPASFFTTFSFSSSSSSPLPAAADSSCSSISFSLSPTSIPLHQSSAAFSVHLISCNHSTSVSYVRIDVGGQLLVESSGSSADLHTKTPQLHCRIHYDGEAKRIQVAASKSWEEPRLMSTLLSYPLDLSNLLSKHKKMLVSITSSTGNSTQTTTTLYSWSFSLVHSGHHGMHSEPLDPSSFVARSTESPPIPEPRPPYSQGILAAMLLLAACSILAVVYAAVVARWPIAHLEYPACPREAGYQKLSLVQETKIESCSLELEG